MIRTRSGKTRSPLLVACCLIAPPAFADGEAPGFYATLYLQSSHLGSTTFDETGNAP